MIKQNGQYDDDSIAQLTDDELISEARKYLPTLDYVGRKAKSALLEALINAWQDQKAM